MRAPGLLSIVGSLFPDDAIGDLFPSGAPPVAAGPMSSRRSWSSKELEGLSHREADEGRLHIDWKVAWGLSLTDKGIHPTTLTYRRRRLRVSDQPRRIFDGAAAVIDATEVLEGKRREGVGLHDRG